MPPSPCHPTLKDPAEARDHSSEPLASVAPGESATRGDTSEAEGRTPDEADSGSLSQILRTTPSPQGRWATAGARQNHSLPRPAPSSAPWAQAQTCQPPQPQELLLLTLLSGEEAADFTLDPLSLRIQRLACFPEWTLIATPLDLLRRPLFTFEKSDCSKAMDRKTRSEGIKQKVVSHHSHHLLSICPINIG